MIKLEEMFKQLQKKYRDYKMKMIERVESMKLEIEQAKSKVTNDVI